MISPLSISLLIKGIERITKLQTMDLLKCLGTTSPLASGQSSISGSCPGSKFD